MTKAFRAISSAEALLALGDLEGACNRAYYAVFAAARAALVSRTGSDMASIGRTHRGLISSFSQELVKTGLVSSEMGRILKRAEEFRLIADYQLEVVEVSDVQELDSQSRAFLNAIQTGLIAAPS